MHQRAWGTLAFFRRDAVWGVVCSVLYEEIVAAEPLPLLLLSFSQTAHACRDEDFKCLFKNKKQNSPVCNPIRQVGRHDSDGKEKVSESDLG